MQEIKAPCVREIKKLSLAETIAFAIDHVPAVDSTTLETLLALVNTSGTFGAISHQQLMAKMCLLVKYIPGTCQYSLLVLLDLLEIPVPARDF